MTFIDNSAEKPTIFQIVLFGILTLFFVLAALHAFYISNTRRHYHRLYSVRFLFPLACLFCAIENISLAASGPIIDARMDHHALLKIVFFVQTTEVPFYLVTIFELTYLVHKRRSVHFCGMYFDEGRLGRRVQGVFSTPVKSFVFRNLIRFVALLCWILGIAANFDILRQTDEVDRLAGRTGWWKLWDHESTEEEIYSLHVLMSLIPTVVLIFCSFFLSIALWRYGSNSSMVVHSSCANPWFFPMFGTIALSVGQLFYERWYSFTSNLGLLIYTITLLALMKEIDKDIVQTAEFTDFLRQVALKGNSISVLNEAGSSHNNTGAAASPDVLDRNQRIWEGNSLEDGGEFSA